MLRTKLDADDFEAIKQERDRLRAAIIEHRSQIADDRCIADDQKLYAALGDGVDADYRVGDKFEMIKNCIAFVEKRCTAGGWVTYAEMRQQRNMTFLLASLLRLQLTLAAAGELPDEGTWKHINEMYEICHGYIYPKDEQSPSPPKAE